MRVALIRSITGKPPVPFFLPPLALMSLAASLERCGHSVSIIDLALTLQSGRDVVDMLAKQEPDMVGIGGIITAYARVKKLAHQIKERFPDTPLVLGGHLASHCPHAILSNIECDIVGHGYAEHLLCELVSAIEDGRNLAGVKGISFRDDSGQIVFNGFPERIKDLDSLPLPAYHLVEMDRYIDGLRGTKMAAYIRKNNLPRSLAKLKAMPVYASRGCSARCSFCVHDITPYRGICFHGNGYLFRHIDLLYNKYEIRHFLVGEEMFLTTPRKLRAFVDVMNSRYPNAYYSFASRANSIHPQMIEEAERGKCVSISVGLESGSQKILDLMGKGTTVEQNITAVKTLANSTIAIGYCMMVGHPGENYRTVRETIATLKRTSHNVSHNTFHTTPYPGSVLYLAALRLGLIKDEDKFLSSISDLPASKLTINLTPYPNTILRCMRDMVANATFRLTRDYVRQLFCRNPLRTVVRLARLLRKLLFDLCLVPLLLGSYFGYRKLMGLVFESYRSDMINIETERGRVVVRNADKYYEGGLRAFLAAET